MIAVVPLAGTWIETRSSVVLSASGTVVPLAGTWIETVQDITESTYTVRRSPCGNVD